MRFADHFWDAETRTLVHPSFVLAEDDRATWLMASYRDVLAVFIGMEDHWLLLREDGELMLVPTSIRPVAPPPGLCQR